MQDQSAQYKKTLERIRGIFKVECRIVAIGGYDQGTLTISGDLDCSMLINQKMVRFYDKYLRNYVLENDDALGSTKSSKNNVGERKICTQCYEGEFLGGVAKFDFQNSVDGKLLEEYFEWNRTRSDARPWNDPKKVIAEQKRASKYGDPINTTPDLTNSLIRDSVRKTLAEPVMNMSHSGCVIIDQTDILKNLRTKTTQNSLIPHHVEKNKPKHGLTDITFKYRYLHRKQHAISGIAGDSNVVEVLDQITSRDASQRALELDETPRRLTSGDENFLEDMARTQLLDTKQKFRELCRELTFKHRKSHLNNECHSGEPVSDLNRRKQWRGRFSGSSSTNGGTRMAKIHGSMTGSRVLPDRGQHSIKIPIRHTGEVRPSKHYSESKELRKTAVCKQKMNGSVDIGDQRLHSVKVKGDKILLARSGIEFHPVNGDVKQKGQNSDNHAQDKLMSSYGKKTNSEPFLCRKQPVHAFKKERPLAKRPDNDENAINQYCENWTSQSKNEECPCKKNRGVSSECTNKNYNQNNVSILRTQPPFRTPPSIISILVDQHSDSNGKGLGKIDQRDSELHLESLCIKSEYTVEVTQSPPDCFISSCEVDKQREPILINTKDQFSSDEGHTQKENTENFRECLSPEKGNNEIWKDLMKKYRDIPANDDET